MLCPIKLWGLDLKCEKIQMFDFGYPHDPVLF